MKNLKLANETLVIGPPKGWDPAIHGECLSISVCVDETTRGRAMTTVWEFSERERKLISEGKNFQMTLYVPKHPVIQIGVQDGEGGVTDVE